MGPGQSRGGVSISQPNTARLGFAPRTEMEEISGEEREIRPGAWGARLPGIWRYGWNDWIDYGPTNDFWPVGGTARSIGRPKAHRFPCRPTEAPGKKRKSQGATQARPRARRFPPQWEPNFRRRPFRGCGFLRGPEGNVNFGAALVRPRGERFVIPPNNFFLPSKPPGEKRAEWPRYESRPIWKGPPPPGEAYSPVPHSPRAFQRKTAKKAGCAGRLADPRFFVLGEKLRRQAFALRASCFSDVPPKNFPPFGPWKLKSCRAEKAPAQNLKRRTLKAARRPAGGC